MDSNGDRQIGIAEAEKLFCLSLENDKGLHEIKWIKYFKNLKELRLDNITSFSGNQIYESEARAKLPQQFLDDTERFERQFFLKDEVPQSAPEP